MGKYLGLATGFAIAVLASTVNVAQADVKVGVVLPLTGANAALGIPLRKGIDLMPKEVNGEKIQLIVLDDTSDPSAAARLTQKLIAEDKVDILLGGAGVPSALAMATVGSREGVQLVSMSPASYPADNNKWIVSIPANPELWVRAMVRDLKKKNAKNVAYIGFSDPFGDLCYSALKTVLGPENIPLLTDERYARSDTSITGQILKILAAKPDAVFVCGSGTPGALPHIALTERGYKGPVYNTPGVYTPDFLRVGGAGVEGAIAFTGPVGAFSQLPDTVLSKKISAEFAQKYDAANGPNTWNGVSALGYDGVQAIITAIPEAMKKAKPGTVEFRGAMRDAIRAKRELIGTSGVFNFAEGNSYGADDRAVITVQVEKGAWKLIDFAR